MLSKESQTNKIIETAPDNTAQHIKVKRNELKYYINYFDYFTLVNKLKYVLKADSHTNSSNLYNVKTLYFDSYDDECLSQKLSGLMYHKKYRMRIYNTSDETVKFEIKNKINNQIFKETALITKESAIKVIKGDFNELLEYNNDILNRIYAEFTTKAFRPVVMIDYVREAYLLEQFDIRVTIDKDLKCNNLNYDIFSKDITMMPVMTDQKYILEIKYNTYLPDYIKSMLQIEAFEKTSISKYAMSRRYFKTKQWEDN